MKTYRVAEGDHARRLQSTGHDHFEQCNGLRSTIFCTQKFLRDRLREVFDNRGTESPYVTIHTRSPHLVTAGLKVDSWSSGPEGETVHCLFEAETRSFDIVNIVEFQVCS